ncbi:MAG: hypothetical protein N3D11_14235 [Candidatus Sumerlaeia bacterium]|nr:hypothetical protein [Candidatus Sumerlaeia bacterium]
MHESLGTSFRVYYGDHATDPQMTYSRKRQILRQAIYEIKKAHRLVPLDQQVVFRLGEVAALHGVLNVMDVLEARAEGTSVAKVRELVRGQEADLLLREAIARLTDCQSEVRYHEVYHYLGMAYENLYMLYGFEEDRQEAKKNYRLAVRYSPCFSRSLYRLFVLLQKDRPPNVDEMREVCRQIAYYDPAMFERQFIQPVVKANERQDYQQVALKADVLLEVMPARYDFWLYRIHALACLGRAKEAALMLDEYERVFPNSDPRFLAANKMEIAAGLGRWSEALAHAETGLAFADLAFFHPYLFAGRGLALERLGRTGEAKSVWAELDRLGQADARFFCAAANLFYYIAGDRARAYDYALKASRASEAIPAAIVRMAAELAFERGEAETAVKLLERALRFDPEDPLSLALLRNAKT